MSEPISTKAIGFALGTFTDGFAFEKFGQEFLAAALGYSFVPAGGTKDRGIDGLAHVFHREGRERTIYQLSIEKGPEGKLKKTLSTLQDNGLDYDSLYLVTNQKFPNKDTATDDAFDSFEKRVAVYDLDWMVAQVRAKPLCERAYERFVKDCLHEYQQPGVAYTLVDEVHDPRLFVFLRQHVDHGPRAQGLKKTLADTLILYSLRDTSPDDGARMAKIQITAEVERIVGFSPKLLEETIDRRLVKLSRKGTGKKVNHHTRDDTYCLPHETRVRVAEMNLDDLALHEAFMSDTDESLKRHLEIEEVNVKEGVKLIEQAVSRIFYDQGMELSHFLLGEAPDEPAMQGLHAAIRDVVTESSVIPKNKEKAALALLSTVREMIYRGTPSQGQYLMKLSRTYMMLFMLRCEPKVSGYFNAMASKLRVYVDTSIMVPAISEYYLKGPQRRYAALLQGARGRGVTLLINDTILDELAAHFQRVRRRYEEEFRRDEQNYLFDESLMLYVDEILIRAYLYAKKAGDVQNFDAYLNNFVSPSMRNAREELAVLLREDFGIERVSTTATSAGVQGDELSRLYEALRHHKSENEKAKNDANLVLMIHKERQNRGEIGDTGAFGYLTWWLSTDRRTERAVQDVFRNQYPTSCCMRPEFLNSYISIAPTSDAVDSAYRELFPSFAGVNISSDIDPKLIDGMHKYLNEHSSVSPGRRKALMRIAADRIKTRNIDGVPRLRSFLDEQVRILEGKTV